MLNLVISNHVDKSIFTKKTERIECAGTGGAIVY